MVEGQIIGTIKRQVFDLPTLKLEITEYIAHVYRLKKHQSSVLEFLKEAEVPFTNNQAKQDVRMAKVKQKFFSCFRSWKGV